MYVWIDTLHIISQICLMCSKLVSCIPFSSARGLISDSSNRVDVSAPVSGKSVRSRAGVGLVILLRFLKYIGGMKGVSGVSCVCVCA